MAAYANLIELIAGFALGIPIYFLIRWIGPLRAAIGAAVLIGLLCLAAWDAYGAMSFLDAANTIAGRISERDLFIFSLGAGAGLSALIRCHLELLAAKAGATP